MRTLRPGTVIYLNGASSSGKGALARALQESVDSLFLHAQMDHLFEAMEVAGFTGAVGVGEEVPPKLARGAAFIHDDWRFVRLELGDEFERVARGFHATIAALAEEGNNVIADDLLTESWMIPSVAGKLGDLPAYLVGVHCAEEELERRERDRGDRFPGIARATAETVHRYVTLYDVEVDTASTSPEDAAEEVWARIARGGPEAFKALRAGETQTAPSSSREQRQHRAGV